MSEFLSGSIGKALALSLLAFEALALKLIINSKALIKVKERRN
jgi:hypothetical protein